jgi:hypothetical protein
VNLFLRLLLAVGCLLTSTSLLAQADDPEPLALPEDVFVAPKTDFPDPKKLEPALRRGLESKNGFCKNEKHELTSSERRLCHLSSSAAERCPGFAKACAKARTGSGPSRSRGRLGEGEEDDGFRFGSMGPLGELLGGIIQVIFWAVIVFGVAAMVWAIVSALVGRRRDAKADRHPDPSAATVHVPLLVMTGTPEELLLRSRDLAMAGDLKAAMSVLLRAFLRHLEIGGRLELHPSRTNGDYLRSLGRHGHDARELRRVVAEVEAVEFGGVLASPETFSAMYGHVSRLVHVAGMLALLFFLGTLSGCQKRPPIEGTVNSCGVGASGYSALCETLAASGAKVRRRFTGIQGVAKEVSHVVVLDDELEFTERKILLDWVDRGGTLVVFDRLSLYDDSLSFSRPCGSELALDPLSWNVPAEPKAHFYLKETYGLSYANAAVIARVRVTCGAEPFALELHPGAGTIVAVADRRLPTNASLAVGDNAALLAALVAPTGATIELIGEWTGTGTDLPFRSLSQSGLLPWFLQILLFGFVLALYRGAPFGSRREPVTVTRRAFAEHAVALGDAYSRARASGLALVNFGGWALERLRVRLAATKHGRLSDLASAVAARHSVNEAEVMSLVVAVRSAEDQAHDSANEAEHLAALRKLAALVKKTGGSS